MLLSWWLRTVIGGGLLLLLAGAVVARTRQPARQLRVAEWAVVAALLLALLSFGPTWLALPVEVPAPPAAVAAATPTPAAVPPAEPQAPADGDDENVIEVEIIPFVPAAPPGLAAAKAAPHTAETAGAPAAAPWWTAGRVAFLLLSVHLAGAAFLLGRLLLGYLGLVRLARSARPAPERVARLCAETAGGRRVRLLVSDRARVPFSFGLLRPTVVLPAGLCESAPDDVLRWVLAHERAHLERRDAWSALLLGLGRALYFFLPWYGWLRRRVRLCQEYLADAAAVAAGRADDYAEFLLGWAGAPPIPAGAAGVSGHSSDLFRRITMLLKSPAPVERRCPTRWSLFAGVGLLAAAVVAAGIGLKAYAAPAPQDEPAREAPKKEEPKKEEPKKEEPKKEAPKGKPEVPGFPDIDKLLENLQPGVPMGPEELRKQIEEIQKQQRKVLEDLARALQKGGAAGGLPNILPGGMPGIRIVPGVRIGRNGGHGTTHEGRLGAMVDLPNPTLVDQLDLPKDQGVVVEDVLPDSAAAKAGIKPHDIILELNGKMVPSKLEDFLKQLEEIKANTPVDAVVMRKGKKETVKGISLPEAKDVPAAPNGRPGRVPAVPRINLPALPGAPALPGLPGGAGGIGLPGLPGGNVVGMSVTRNGDSVTARLQDNGAELTLTGKVSDGQVKVEEITVQDGGEAKKYDSVEKVPEQYRDQAKKLVEAAAKGGVRRVTR
jgi:beta-lactamase regulating signal transducer with metallopeptidase domain